MISALKVECSPRLRGRMLSFRVSSGVLDGVPAVRVGMVFEEGEIGAWYDIESSCTIALEISAAAARAQQAWLSIINGDGIPEGKKSVPS